MNLYVVYVVVCRSPKNDIPASRRFYVVVLCRLPPLKGAQRHNDIDADDRRRHGLDLTPMSSYVVDRKRHRTRPLVQTPTTGRCRHRTRTESQVTPCG